MTTPCKRTRVVIRTKSFLRALTDPSKTPGVPEEIRQRAEVLLRHFPCAAHLFIAAADAPQSWGDPSAWELEGTLDQLAESGARASAAADDVLAFIDASNRRIAAMESRAQVTAMHATNLDNRGSELVQAEMRSKRNPTAPTLFLDFDGVLHPDAVYRVAGKIVLEADGISLFEWAPVLEEILVPYPELQIVLSTSWVRVLGFDEALRWLPEALQRRVVGATWHRQGPRDWVFLTRYKQILGNVARHQHSKWLSIDDMGEGWAAEHRERLVLTDSWLGLGAAAAQQELREKLEVLHR